MVVLGSHMTDFYKIVHLNDLGNDSTSLDTHVTGALNLLLLVLPQQKVVRSQLGMTIFTQDGLVVLR